MPGVVDGMGGRFITATEMIVGIDGLDVECEEFLFATSNGEGYGGVGAEDVPQDIAEESKYGSESIESESEEKDTNHTIF